MLEIPSFCFLIAERKMRENSKDFVLETPGLGAQIAGDSWDFLEFPGYHAPGGLSRILWIAEL